MKTVNTKVYNEKLNRSTKHKDIKNIDYNIIDDSSTTSLPTSKKTVFFVGDSMEKNLNGFYITKRNKHKYLTKARSFNSAKTRCVFDHAKPTIEKINPEHITLYIGLNWEETASQIETSITELANSLKNKTNTIHISFIITRNDGLNNKVNEVIMEL